MTRNVGIVIVSHSPLVAEGTADMVRQMVGDEVPLAWCGGDPGGGLGTSVEAILAAIDRAWSERGVAILVDLGLSAEGPWIDAKSIVKVMAAKAPKNTVLYFRAEGDDAAAALAALITLVERDFADEA